MKTTQIIGLLIPVILGLFSVACADGRANAVYADETTAGSPAPAATPVDDLSIPEGWVLFPTPKAESRERTCANYSYNGERKVAIKDGALQISPFVYEDKEQLGKLAPDLRKAVEKRKIAGYLHVEPFGSGFLIGSDAGEWGGSLLWLGNDGSRPTELLKDNVRGIASVGREVYVLTGLAHLTSDEGKIYKLKGGADGADTLALELVSDLKTQPEAFAVENDESFLIAVKNKILRVKTTGGVETLKETNFRYLYPNSMVVTPSGIVYVGMRLFVVRFVPQENGYEEQWLVPQNCRKFVEKDFGCVCVPGS